MTLKNAIRAVAKSILIAQHSPGTAPIFKQGVVASADATTYTVDVDIDSGTVEKVVFLNELPIPGQTVWIVSLGAGRWLGLGVQSRNNAGLIIPFGGTASNIPSGYLPCEGGAYSRTTYAILFDKIGTAFGAGDGSTTFNVPDMRGKMAVGLNTGWSLNDTNRINIDHTHSMQGHTHVYWKSAATVQTSTSGPNIGSTGVMSANATLPTRVVRFIIKA